MIGADIPARTSFRGLRRSLECKSPALAVAHTEPHDFSVLQIDAPIRHPDDLGIVGRKDEGHLCFLVDLAHEFENAAAGPVIEIGGRLVCKNDFRSARAMATRWR